MQLILISPREEGIFCRLHFLLRLMNFFKIASGVELDVNFSEIFFLFVSQPKYANSSCLTCKST